MAAADQGGGPQNLATAVAEVSERATVLIREEIELAKAEVSERIGKILKGTVVAAAAGIFVLTALFFVLIGFALLLYYELPGNPYTFFWGFFAMALILLVLGVIAGFLAAKAVRAASPPVPEMAIDEARKIREAVNSSSSSTETKGEADASALSRRDS
ncbi:MAG: phage holin family protein [Solirubrobacteraceae bacterium]